MNTVTIASAYYAETSKEHIFCHLDWQEGLDAYRPSVCWCEIKNNSMCPLRAVAIRMADIDNLPTQEPIL